MLLAHREFDFVFDSVLESREMELSCVLVSLRDAETVTELLVRTITGFRDFDAE
jgi:hypothetical protein